MPAIAAADVTVTPVADERYIAGRKRFVPVTIAFGDGALTYPSGGVPMPAFEKFGMVRNLEDFIMTDGGNASGIIWKYDKANAKMRGWLPTGGAGTQPATPAAPTSGTPTMSGADSTTITTHTHASIIPGLGAELATTATPAAQSLKGYAVGW